MGLWILKVQTTTSQLPFLFIGLLFFKGNNYLFNLHILFSSLCESQKGIHDDKNYEEGFVGSASIANSVVNCVNPPSS